MRKMNDSGVEWIGEIPEGWKVVRTKNVFSNCKKIVGNESDDYERLSLTLNGVLKKSKEDNTGLQPDKFEGYQILKERELVFKLIDLENVKTSRVGLSMFTGLVSPAYIILNNPRYTKYGYYFYLSMWHREIFNMLSDDGVRSNLNTKDLLNIPFALPPIESQFELVSYLDEKVAIIDNIIEKTKESIEEYKKYKQSLITETVTKGLDPNVKMKDSGIEWIGKIPEHWQVKKLRYILKFSTGLSITKAEFVEVGVPCVNYGDIHSKYSFDLDVSRDKLNFVSEKHLDNKFAMLAMDDDFIFCDTSEDIDGSGNCLFVRNTDGKAVFAGSHTILGKPKIDMHSPYFGYLLKSKSIKSQVQSSVVGIKVFSITQKILKNISIIIPTFDEQILIADMLDEMSKEIENIISSKKSLISELESYKKSLIYEVVTGKKEIN